MNCAPLVAHPVAEPPTQYSFILSLLEQATLSTTTLTPGDITLVQDNAHHLPCPLSKTWRKQHGWCDIDDANNNGSAHTRWQCTAELRGEPIPTHADTAEEPYSKAPSPPQRQSSMNSYSSMEMEHKMKQFQKEKAQQRLSSRNKPGQEPKHKTNQKGSSAPSFGTQKDGRPAFQYPPAFMSSSTLSTAASTFASLELVPEDDVTVDSHEAMHMQMPPRRQGSDMTLDSQRTTSSTSSAVPIMPQRQLSEQSFASLGSSGRHHHATVTSASRFNNSDSNNLISRSDHSRTSVYSSRNDDSDRSSSAHSRLSHFAIPQSLFKAPPMPQRQESFSTVGSRSSLASQDSFRSLASGSVASISAASMGSSSQRSTSYRGSCPLIAEAMAAHHAYPEEEDYEDDIDDESTAVPFTPMVTPNKTVDDFLSKHKPTLGTVAAPSLAGTTVSTSCSNAPEPAARGEGSAHRRSTNPQITAFLNPLQQGKSYAGKPLAIA